MRNASPLTLSAAAILIGSAAFVPTLATGEERITPLLQQTLEGIDGYEANIAFIDIDPGWETERHTHPGHVFIYVIEGTVELDLEDKGRHTIAAGEAIYELPNVPMVGRNASSTEGARLVVFQVGESGKELTVAAPK